MLVNCPLSKSYINSNTNIHAIGPLELNPRMCSAYTKKLFDRLGTLSETNHYCAKLTWTSCYRTSISRRSPQALFQIEDEIRCRNCCQTTRANYDHPRRWKCQVRHVLGDHTCTDRRGHLEEFAEAHGGSEAQWRQRAAMGLGETAGGKLQIRIAELRG